MQESNNTVGIETRVSGVSASLHPFNKTRCVWDDGTRSLLFGARPVKPQRLTSQSAFRTIDDTRLFPDNSP